MPDWFVQLEPQQKVVVVSALLAIAGVGWRAASWARKKYGEFTPSEEQPSNWEEYLAETDWPQFNHSQAAIALVEINPAVEPHLHGFIAKTAIEFGPITDDGVDWTRFEANEVTVHRVDEKAASINFRVVGAAGDPVLLRIHKRLSNPIYRADPNRERFSALRTVLWFQEAVADQKELFTGHSRYLRPLRRRVDNSVSVLQVSGEEIRTAISIRSEPLLLDEYYVTVQPFFDAAFSGSVRHYAGSSLAELADVGRKFAQLVNHVESKVQPTPLALAALEAARADMHLRRQPLKQIIEKYEEIQRRLVSTPAALSYLKRLQEYWALHKPLLNEAWALIRRQYDARLRDAGEVVLQDFHPHNVFVDSSTNVCVLIYDYEGFGRNWSPSAALSFAVHRFTREYLRNVIADESLGASPDPKQALIESTEAFLGGFRRGGGQIPVNFVENLWWEIIAISLNKYLRCAELIVERLSAADHHPYAYDEDELLGVEMPKFIASIKEARVYSLLQASDVQP